MEINYGVQIEPQFGYDFNQIYEICKSAEENNFSHAWFSDHFMMTKDSTDQISYEAFTAMMAAASKTEKLRIGALVFCNSYRHPAVLAKQAASFDHFSGGRLEFGLGAGWKQIEYDAYGIDYPSASVRIRQLSEAIDVIRKLWTEEKANYSGEFYNLKDAVSFPKPLQEPYPPIWLGTMEAKEKMLTLSAQKADGLNIAWSFAPDVFQEKLERIDQYCDKFERDPKSLMLSYGVWTKIYRDEQEKNKVWQEICDKRGFTMEQLAKRYEGSLHGTEEEVIEKIKQYRKLGINYFIFMFPQHQEVESIKIFKERIMPKI